MRTLCIDTSSDVCSVCIMEDNNLIELKELKNGKTHSENLMTLIQEAVGQDGLNKIEAIACCVGPGSFTGIRIGIATIKAIAEVKSLPVIGVTSLESLAYNEEFNGLICSMIDARNSQVYAGVFKNHELIGEYIADDIDIVLNSINNNEEILFIGNGAQIHKEKILQKFGPKANFTEKNEQTSISVGKCAYKKDKYDNADTILPLYLRKSQAERMKDVIKNDN